MKMMLNSGKLIGLAGLLTLLTACSAGGDSNCVSGNDCANLTPPESINFAFPAVDAIEELTDGAGFNNGVYSRAGSIIATDHNGNSLADGAIIQLDAIDTLLARGTLDAVGDIATGTSLTDLAPATANDVAGDPDPNFTPTDLGLSGSSFQTAFTSYGRTGGPVSIEANDYLLLFGANADDQVRLISAAPTATSVSVTKAFSNTYNDTSGLTYAIGKSNIGVQMIGIDPDTGDRLVGFTRVKDGIASFRIEYPGDKLNTGRFPNSDYRYEIGTSGVYIIAQVDGNPRLTAVTPAGFSGIADLEGSIGGSCSGTAGGTAFVTVNIIDANKHAYAMAPVTAQSSDTAIVNIIDSNAGAAGIQYCVGQLSPSTIGALDENGNCTIAVGLVAAGSADILVSSGGLDQTISCTVN